MPEPTQTPADLRRALAVNAVGPALNERDEWLPLSVRQAVADAVLAAIDGEQQPAPTPAPVAHATPCGPNVCGVVTHEGTVSAPEPGLREQAARISPLADVKGRCPACGWASLFLGDGGYVTCSRIECPEPDAASTLLERDTRDPS